MPKSRQYQQFVEPILPSAAPAVPSSASWQGSRPDTLRRVVLNVALVPAFFWSTFTPAAAPAVPTLSQPVYPDRINARTYPVYEQPSFAWVPGLPNLPVVLWPPVYPERVERAAYPVEQQAAFFWSTFTPAVAPAVPTFFQPVYPDRISARTYPVNEQPSLAWVPGLPNLPVVLWPPTYPDQIKGRAYPVSAQPSFAWSTFAPAAAPGVPTQFQSIYPDRISARAYPVHEQQPFFYTPAVGQFPVPALSWQGIYPDILEEIQKALEGGPATFTPVVVAPPAPELSWVPEYPDSLRGLPFVVEFPAFAWNPFTPAAPAAPDAGPPWKMRAVEEGLWLPPKVIVGQVVELRRRKEERMEIELTAGMVADTLENRRQGVASQIELQRQEALAALRRREIAMTNLTKAQLKKELGTLDPAELVRQKNIQAKRVAALKKARQALKRKRKK